MMKRARNIIAQYAATCETCGRGIRVGQRIWWKRGENPRHVDCQAARWAEHGCTACSGRGCHWNNLPCRACDGTGSRAVQDFARAGGHPRKDGASC
jgi:hypothetical protein